MENGKIIYDAYLTWCNKGLNPQNYEVYFNPENNLPRLPSERKRKGFPEWTIKSCFAGAGGFYDLDGIINLISESCQTKIIIEGMKPSRREIRLDAYIGTVPGYIWTPSLITIKDIKEAEVCGRLYIENDNRPVEIYSKIEVNSMRLLLKGENSQKHLKKIHKKISSRWDRISPLRYEFGYRLKTNL